MDISTIKLHILLILLLVPQCLASYAVLSVTVDPSQDKSHSYCTQYNPDYTHLNTQSAPSLNDYLLAVSNTSYDPYGCTPPPPGVVTNQTLVLLRGNCTFSEKAYLAQLGGAEMVVVVYDGLDVSVPELNDSVTIPVLMVDNVTGGVILDNISTTPLYIYGFLPPSVPFDPSEVLLFLIAVVTVFVGSFLANTPYEFMRYGLLIRKGENTGPSLPQASLDKVSVLGVVISLLVMIVVVCAILLLLYFFYYPMVYIVLALYSLAAVLALYNLLSPFVALIPIDNMCRLPPNQIPILRYRPGPLFPITILISVAIVTWWVVERHALYAWVLQDLLGFAFITFLYKRLGSILTPWMVAVLMCILFFYDIFMVFITPLFTSDGVSIMEKAAIGPPGGTERLPIVFTVLKFIYPTQLDTVCSLARSYGLLGYGDVGIPGLLVTLGLKHDLKFRPDKCFRIYYATSGIAYIVGLVCTYIALTFMKTAQPALLYLVPTTLLAVLVVSLLRREFRFFFTGKRKMPSEVGVASADREGRKMSTDRGDTDSEKSPLVNSVTT